MKQKLLVFVVAYNAERTIESVLTRIPGTLAADYDTEILVIDDSSRDATFERARRFEQDSGYRYKVTVLYNPVNQGYGGNQKIGYQYAIRHGFDAVVLLHGDGQYAPEKLPALVQRLFTTGADAVFGSRMMVAADALRGGMPLYKWLGNRVLTTFQNLVLGQHLTEFHSGYRVYRVQSLAQLPFELNTRDFHFDTEIIIQLLLARMRIVELPIPTYYGDEICHVNGLRYAWDVVKATLVARLQGLGIFYQKRYDIARSDAHELTGNRQTYQDKGSFLSTHSLAVADVPAGARVVDIGCGSGHIARALAGKGCHVTGLDQLSTAPEGVAAYHRLDLDHPEFPVSLQQASHVLLLDVVEHAANPEQFMRTLYRACGDNFQATFIVSTGNIAFLPVRLALLLGAFRYGKRGILDMTHKRLFTFATFCDLFEETGFVVKKVVGVPAPIPLALGDTALARFLLWLNALLIRVGKGLFAYQIYLHVQPYPSVDYLLERAILTAGELKQD